MPPFIVILTELVFILLQFFVFLFNYTLWGKKLFQPAVLFSFVWFIMPVLHFIFRFTLLNELIPLSAVVCMVFLAGTVCFSAGGALIYLYNRKRSLYEQKNYPPLAAINLLFKTMLVVVVIIGLPFYILASYKIFGRANICFSFC